MGQDTIAAAADLVVRVHHRHEQVADEGANAWRTGNEEIREVFLSILLTLHKHTISCTRTLMSFPPPPPSSLGSTLHWKAVLPVKAQIVHPLRFSFLTPPLPFLFPYHSSPPLPSPSTFQSRALLPVKAPAVHPAFQGGQERLPLSLNVLLEHFDVQLTQLLCNGLQEGGNSNICIAKFMELTKYLKLHVCGVCPIACPC